MVFAAPAPVAEASGDASTSIDAAFDTPRGGVSSGAGGVEPPPSAANAPSENPGNAQCFPQCRDGYVCHQGQCISLCNPPCRENETCVEGRRCEPELTPPSGVAEPLPPKLKAFEERGFFMLGFHYGFSGSLAEEGSLGTLTVDPASTYGFNLRGDVPIESYLLLGPFVQLGTWRADVSPVPSRNYYVDADLYVRGRIPISSGSMNFQIWAGVPVGLSFDLLGDEPPGVSGAGFGWNIGGMAGAAVHFSPKLGLFIEMGYLAHRVTHGAEPNVYLRLSQWNVNTGFVFRN